jgi:hypothetical protein
VKLPDDYDGKLCSNVGEISLSECGMGALNIAVLPAAAMSFPF